MMLFPFCFFWGKVSLVSSLENLQTIGTRRDIFISDFSAGPDGPSPEPIKLRRCAKRGVGSPNAATRRLQDRSYPTLAVPANWQTGQFDRSLTLRSRLRHARSASIRAARVSKRVVGPLVADLYASRAEIEKQLPFSELRLDRYSFRLRPWIATRSFAELDEREWVPANSHNHSRGGCPVAKHGENGMRSDLAKPIGAVAGIRLLPVNDGVPIAAFGGFDVLRDGMRLSQHEK